MKFKNLIIILVVLAVGISVFLLSKENKMREKAEKVEKVEEEVENTSKNDNERKKMPPFKLKDLNGKEVTDDIFKDYDLTIVTVWQLECGPCYYELEALNKIYNMYKDKGVNVIGISLDDVDDNKIEEIKEATDKIGIQYTNLIANEDYVCELIKYITGTPTTIFVDSEGYFVRNVKVGTDGVEKDFEEFKNIIEKLIPSSS